MHIFLYIDTPNKLEVARIEDTQYAAFADVLESIIVQHETPDDKENSIISWSGGEEYRDGDDKDVTAWMRPPICDARYMSGDMMFIEIFQ